jgi:hypothetical protein
MGLMQMTIQTLLDSETIRSMGSLGSLPYRRKKGENLVDACLLVDRQKGLNQGTYSIHFDYHQSSSKKLLCSVWLNRSSVHSSGGGKQLI